MARTRSMDHRAYDGSSYLSSRVMKESNRRTTQVRDDGVHDGPSWPWRSVVTMMVLRVIRRPCQFLSQMILLLETTKQVVTIDTNLPIVRPRTITKRKTRARKSTWICKKVWISFLHISLLLSSGLFNWPILPLNLDGCNLPWSQLADFSISNGNRLLLIRQILIKKDWIPTNDVVSITMVSFQHRHMKYRVHSWESWG